MKTFYVTSRDRQEIKRHKMRKGQSELITFDWGAYAEDAGALTGVTWAVESGQAAIASEALSASVATAQITTAERGWTLIKLVATDGTDIDVQHLEIRAIDPFRPADDYGLIR